MQGLIRIIDGSKYILTIVLCYSICSKTDVKLIPLASIGINIQTLCAVDVLSQLRIQKLRHI